MSNLTYPTARALMDRALASPRGITATFPTVNRAKSMRHACYVARKREAETRLKTEDKDSELYGGSPYYLLDFVISEGAEGRGVLTITHDGDEALEKMGAEIKEL